MSRYLVNADPLDRLDWAATNWMKDERPPEPCRVVRADQTPVCPPCQSRVTYSELEIVETCVKCGTERRRARAFPRITLNRTERNDFETLALMARPEKRPRDHHEVKKGRGKALRLRQAG